MGTVATENLTSLASVFRRQLAETGRNNTMASGMNLDRVDEEHRTMSAQNSWERRELALLASYAMFASESVGRVYDEPPHEYRSPFQRDRDRVLHSSAFRRLSGKMQVFTGEMGDYHRTRLTHTHEVANIARTLGRVLRLNEDLIEALALLHDIGHPPYGHSGEDALDECLGDHGGFSHNRFALDLVQTLEIRYTTYPGLNLSREVLAGQDFRITHEGCTPLLEVQIVDLADSLAYNAHDVDDALALGLLDFDELAKLDLVDRAIEYGMQRGHARTQLGSRKSLVHSLIDVQVADLLNVAREKLATLDGVDSRGVQELGIEIEMSPVIASEREQLSQYLFDRVYRHATLCEIRKEAAQRVSRLYELLVAHPQILPSRFQSLADQNGVEPTVGQFIGGMTDRMCDAQYQAIVVDGCREAELW
ncbi:MAG: dNTP triphosphohydrolase [Aureliella sp.]